MNHWLNFEKIQDFDFIIYKGFQYDDITDADILKALAASDALSKVDTNCDWEFDTCFRKTDETSLMQNHAYRIAALVLELNSGGKIKNRIEIDSFAMQSCCSCVNNGHHRIRALQYLGLKSGPFSLSGDLDVMDELVVIAGDVCPDNATHFFNEELLINDEPEINQDSDIYSSRINQE